METWVLRALSSALGSGRFLAWVTWQESYFQTPVCTTMPRGRLVDYFGFDRERGGYAKFQAPNWIGRLGLDATKYRDALVPPEPERKKLERFRLYSTPTRHYMCRRAWRYFRRLGKTNPERYVAAVSEALVLYQDSDVESGLALIDNWGLVHALFHNSPVLVAKPRGWQPAKDRSLSELEPAPIYEELWRSAPRKTFDLMRRARCRPVRQWALRMLGRDPAAARAVVGIEDVIGLVGHEDPEVVAFAIEWLRGAADVSSVAPERWLAIAESASPDALELLAEIMERQIAPGGSRSSRPPGWPRAVRCRSPGSAWAGSRPGARPRTTNASACWRCSKPSPSRSVPRSWPGCGPLCHPRPSSTPTGCSSSWTAATPMPEPRG